MSWLKAALKHNELDGHEQLVCPDTYDVGRVSQHI